MYNEASMLAHYPFYNYFKMEMRSLPSHVRLPDPYCVVYYEAGILVDSLLYLFFRLGMYVLLLWLAPFLPVL